MKNSKLVIVRLFLLKRLFSFLDYLSHFQFSRTFIVNSKLYIGAAIISTTAIQTSCSTKTKSSEPKIDIGEKGIDTVSTKKFAQVDSTGTILKSPKKIVHPNNKLLFGDPIEVSCYEVAIPSPPEPEPMCYLPAYVPEPKPEPGPYIKVDVEPEFPGGSDSLKTYANNHIIYPQEAIELGLEGLCVVQYVIGISGKVEDVQLLKSSGSPLLDSEALRVISHMPAWKPGTNNSDTVRVQKIIPIRFTLPIENTTK